MAQETKEKKVVFCGIDNGGKSSIIKFLNKNYENMLDQSPTKGIDVQTDKIPLFGLNLHIWDFGGQISYRNDYLRKKSKYLSGIKAVIYVIDVQNERRYDESAQYLLELGNAILEINPEIKDIFVFFHKFDPELKKNDRLIDELDLLYDKITSLPLEINFHFYETSIFSGSELLRGFSDGIIYQEEKSDKLNCLIKSFAEEIGLLGAILVSNKTVTLAKYALNPDVNTIIQTIPPRLANLLLDMENLNLNGNSIAIDFNHRENESIKGVLVFVPLIIGDELMFLLNYNEEIIKKEIIFEKTKKLIKSIEEII